MLRHRFLIAWCMPATQRVIQILVSFMLLSFGILVPAKAQPEDYLLKSTDEELTMELSRKDYVVKVALTFAHAKQLDYAVIERSTEPNAGFRQCKHINLSDQTRDSVCIAANDNYPLAATQNVYYRIKTVTKEGVSRTYPAIRLPAVAALPSELKEQ